MAVMAAGMHDSRILRCILFRKICLLYGKRVYIGTKSHRTAVMPAADNADTACNIAERHHLDPHLFQFFCDTLRCFHLMTAQLGMGMEMAAQCRNIFFFSISKRFDIHHGRASFSR